MTRAGWFVLDKGYLDDLQVSKEWIEKHLRVGVKLMPAPHTLDAPRERMVSLNYISSKPGEPTQTRVGWMDSQTGHIVYALLMNNHTVLVKVSELGSSYHRGVSFEVLLRKGES